MGFWNESIKAWWYHGLSGEYIAWYGAHEITVYERSSYPSLPIAVIKGKIRIESSEDFENTLINGVKYKVEYTKTN